MEQEKDNEKTQTVIDPVQNIIIAPGIIEDISRWSRPTTEEKENDRQQWLEQGL